MAINPSLLIIPDRFKAGKLYSQLPESGDGDFTVVRSTTATRVNASGLIESVASGVPRLDYTGGGCPALLVEPAATNLITYSEQFNDLAYIKLNLTVTANDTTAPDGNLTADKIIETAIIGEHFIFRAILPSGVCTSSVFAKQGERKNLVFGNATFGVYAIFDLSNETVVSISGSQLSNPKIENYGNGWYRCSVVNTNNDLRSIGIGVANDAGTMSYLGDGTSGLFIWGAQVEVGSVATSYIPTVAATVTRNADVISLSSASGLIGQTEGVLYAEIDIKNITQAVSRSVIFLSDGTTSNRVRIQYQFITSRHVLVCTLSVGGVTIYEKIATIGTDVVNGTIKIAFAYASGNNEVYQNGAVLAGATSGAGTFAGLPNIGQINLGSDQSGTAFTINDRISAAALYTTRLDNATLESLTTL